MEIKASPKLLIAVSTVIIFIILAGFQIQDNLTARDNDQPAVLAADTTSNTYDLIENTDQQGDSISDYEPVTISHTVKEGDTIYSIADTYNADPQTIIDYPYNKVGDDLVLEPDQILIIPNGYLNTPPPELPIVIGSGLFTWPASGSITQYSFWWHPGSIDIGAEFGSPVAAAYSGKVIAVEYLQTGYGWHTIVEHSNGYTTLYAHMSRIDVEVGQTVQKGTALGLVGSTGRSTGSHLHFETRKNGQPVNPMSLLPPVR